MEAKNREINYRKNNSKLNIIGAKTADRKERNETVIQGNRQEFTNYENDSINQLRECVLNKLWGSVPPEAQFSQLSQSDDLDSDGTEFDLEEEDDEEEQENEGRTQSSETIFPSNSSSRDEDELNALWEVNFDFIQAIIWLKSSATKRDRIPAGEFCKIFRNQWALSKKIMSSNLGSETGASKTAAETETSVFRRPLNPISVDFPPPINQQNAKIPETKRGRVRLLKARLRSFDIAGKSLRDVVIPETDESETGSVSSISSQRLIPKIRTSETTKGQSTVDSGFNSEKPESSDSVNTGRHTGEEIESRIGNGGKNTVSKSAEMNSVKLLQHNLFGVADTRTGRTILSKRKHDGIPASSERKFSKKPRLSISSATVNYILKGSEFNELLFRSVRALLDVLSKEKSACSICDWQSSAQKEAVEAIVSIVDQLNKEKGPDTCRKEVVGMVKKLLQRMLHSNEFDKVMTVLQAIALPHKQVKIFIFFQATIWEHHRLMVFELCNAFTVCTEVVDYLIGELKKLIPMAARTIEINPRESMVLFKKSSVIFQSLEILLRKYKVLESNSADAGREQTTEKVPEVTELWKRGSETTRKQPDVFVVGLRTPESSEDREQAWITVLEELSLASTRHLPLVKVSAWQCLSVLKSSRGG